MDTYLTHWNEYFVVTEQVKVSEIQLGDHIMSHGVIFEITSSVAYPGGDFNCWHQHGASHLPVYVHHTKVVADNSNGHFPKSWQGDYTIQSNDLMTWARIVSQ